MVKQSIMKYLTARYCGAVSGVLISSALIFVISCKKEPKPPPSTSAKGFLTSFQQSCNPGRVHGIWYNGVSAGTDSNYVEVTLNVTSAGSYNITTDKLNGVSFSGSGAFSSSGVYKVRLKPSGAFVNWGPTSFPVRFDSSSCNFIVYVQDSAALSMADNTWELTASGNYYNGPVNGQSSPGLNFPPGAATAFDFLGTGWSGRTEDTVMAIDISGGGSILDTIPYQTNGNGTSFYIKAMDTTKANPYLIQAYSSPPTAIMTIRISSMIPWITDDTYKTVVYGTFDGGAIDYWHQNHVVPITKGRFKIVK